FVSLNISPARSGGSDRSISLLIADHLLIKQIHRAFFVCVSLCLVSLVFCQSGLGLGDRGFERARINLKKEIALLNDTAFLIIARDDVALHLRVDIGVDESVERRDALQDAW